MKLSEKGLNEILDGLDSVYGDRNYNKRHLKSIQFNQSHFEGVICLTVEEARSISNMISVLTENEIPELISWDNLLKMRKRIEQAENM